jgi:hypothetical protein
MGYETLLLPLTARSRRTKRGSPTPVSRWGLAEKSVVERVE